jgi:hypothetical protein
MRELVDTEIDRIIEELNVKREALYAHADKIEKKVSKDAWFKKGEIIYGFSPMAQHGKIKVISAIVSDPGKIQLWNNNFAPCCMQSGVCIHVLGVEVRDTPKDFESRFNYRQWSIDRAESGKKITFDYNPRGRVYPWKKQDWYDKHFKQEG